MARCLWLAFFAHVLAWTMAAFGGWSGISRVGRSRSDPFGRPQTMFEWTHDRAMAKVRRRAEQLEWGARWTGR